MLSVLTSLRVYVLLIEYIALNSLVGAWHSSRFVKKKADPEIFYVPVGIAALVLIRYFNGEIRLHLLLLSSVLLGLFCFGRVATLVFKAHNRVLLSEAVLIADKDKLIVDDLSKMN